MVNDEKKITAPLAEGVEHETHRVIAEDSMGLFSRHRATLASCRAPVLWRFWRTEAVAVPLSRSRAIRSMGGAPCLHSDRGLIAGDR